MANAHVNTPITGAIFHVPETTVTRLGNLLVDIQTASQALSETIGADLDPQHKEIALHNLAARLQQHSAESLELTQVIEQTNDSRNHAIYMDEQRGKRFHWALLDACHAIDSLEAMLPLFPKSDVSIGEISPEVGVRGVCMYLAPITSLMLAMVIDEEHGAAYQGLPRRLQEKNFTAPNKKHKAIGGK